MWCNECNQYFADDEVEIRIDEDGNEEYVCPYCGSDYIIASGECVCCGEPCDPEYDFCESCRGIIESGIFDLINDLKPDDSYRFKYSLGEYISNFLSEKL